MIQKKEIKKILMSLDPSINNMGMAVWNVGEKKLLMWKLLHPSKDARLNEFEKSNSMLDQIRQWKQTYGVTDMISEVPEHWDVGGFEARETGSIPKLMFMCGMVYSLRSELNEFKLVTPRQWKGQLKKEVTANRLKDSYTQYGIDLTTLNHNVMDAIAIGHFYLYGRV